MMKRLFPLLGLVAGLLPALRAHPGEHPAAGAGPEISLGTDAARPTSEAIPPYRARFGRSRPIIAVVGENRGTETVDFVVPYGILSRADVATVVAVGTRPGPIQLRPALRIQPLATTSGFDADYPDSADYVIVPAVMHHDDPGLLAWISAQAGKGATIVGICDGVFVLGNAGLLKGHQATGHWFTQRMREKRYPETQWRRNVRYVADERIITTSGVTAAIPASIALVEAIAGQAKAAAVAHDLGVSDWSPRHDATPFHLGTRRVMRSLGNTLAFWSHETVGLPVADGVDEVPLALVADAYSRTYRSKAWTVGSTNSPIRTLGGLELIPDQSVNSDRVRLLPTPTRDPILKQLEQALTSISERYGRTTAAWVATQMEYPWSEGL